MNAEIARAVVLVWTARGRAFGESFDGYGCLDRAHNFADDLRARNDFPGALICVTGNQKATDERRDRIITDLRLSGRVSNA